MPRGRKPRTPEEADRGYRTGAWKGSPNYECLRCPHACLEEAEMLRHIAEFHPEALPTVRPTGVVGADGTEIMEEILPAPLEVDPGGDVVEPEPESDRYTVETWYAMPNYVCRACPFRTLDRRLIDEHVKVHGR